MWDHSGDELVFQNWDTVGSQPSGGTAEDCALSDEGLWHDYPCDSRYNIICERGKSYKRYTDYYANAYKMINTSFYSLNNVENAIR